MSIDIPHDDHFDIYAEKAQEITAVADTIIQAFDLARHIAVADLQPTSSAVTLSIDCDQLDALNPDTIPDEIRGLLGNSSALEITYFTAILGERPAMEVKVFTGDTVADRLVAVVSRSGSSLDEAEPFTGELDDGSPIHVHNDDVAVLTQELVRLEENIFVDQFGVNKVDSENFVADPQYPPAARFIEDTLIQKNASYSKVETYTITIEEHEYAVQIVTDFGETTRVEVADITQGDIAIVDGEPQYAPHAIVGTVSHTDFQQAITFQRGTLPHLKEYDGQDGDLLRLRETMSLLSDHITPR